MKSLTEFSTGSVRDSSKGKPHFEHLSDVEEGIKALCAVLEFGKTKYSRNNWRKGQNYMRVLASLLRHVFAIARGEDIDPESGKPHTGHIMCNAAFLEHYRVYRDRYLKADIDLDDRDGMPESMA